MRGGKFVGVSVANLLDYQANLMSASGKDLHDHSTVLFTSLIVPIAAIPPMKCTTTGTRRS